MICFTIIELCINTKQSANIGFWQYTFGYLLLLGSCIVFVNHFQKKLKEIFPKIIPYFSQIILISALLYWLYYSVVYDPFQTPFINTILIL